MEALSKYFMPEQEYYLDSVSYGRIEKNIDTSEVQIICNDTIVAKENEGNRIIVTVTRKVYFKPDVLFDLEVSYGTILKFNEKKSEVDWDHMDLSKEFQDHGSFVTDNLFRRISLLISEITSSFGQPPIIVPPQFFGENR